MRTARLAVILALGGGACMTAACSGGFKMNEARGRYYAEGRMIDPDHAGPGDLLPGHLGPRLGHDVGPVTNGVPAGKPHVDCTE